MIKIKRRHWHLLSRRFWGTLFTVLIAIAVCIQLGRQAFPLINDYQDEIAQYFGDKLGVKIQVASMNAEWKGLRPKLSLQSVDVISDQEENVFSVKQITAELSIINSVLDRRLSWRQLKFSGLSTRLAQSENGQWQVVGMPEFARKPQKSNKKSNPAINDPYDVFLFGRRIGIENAKFALQYFGGETSEVLIPEITIENDKEFHRIRAQLDIDERKAFSFLVEGHGDPRDSTFVANGFLELDAFPTQNVVSALALNEKIHVEDNHAVDLRLWFKGDSKKGTTMRGELTSAGKAHLSEKEIELPLSLDAKIFGRAQFFGGSEQEKGWQVTLKDLQANWQDVSSPATNISLYGEGRALKGIKIKELDVQPWVELANHVAIKHPKAKKHIATLAPKGLIKNLDVKITDKDSGYFLATANVEKGYANAIMGAPALSNVNGYLSTSMLTGSIDVFVKDGFTLFLPKVYHNPMEFEEAKGQVSWDIDLKKRMTYISSGLITVKNPEEEGRGYLHLSLPFAKKYGRQEMTLAIGIKNTLAKNHKKYVPKAIPKHLYRWLDTSIKKGRIANAKFLYHGSVEKNASVKPSIQLYGEVHDGNLVFDPKWPELDEVTGTITLENNDLDVRISQASLLGNSVYDAAITLVDDPSDKKQQALSIEGSLASDAQAAMTLLKRSPIKQHIGSTFDKWEFSGGVGAKVELIVPLASDSKGFSHNIDVSFNDADIKMPDLDLHLQKISGDLFYNTEKGMFADKLQGEIWGRGIDGAISTLPNDEGSMDTVIDFSGRASIDDLYAWTKRPELNFARGESTVLGKITIPGEGSDKTLQIDVSSPLVGVALNFPEPFNKAAETPIDFSSRLRIKEDKEEYVFRFSEKLRLSVLNTRSGQVSAKFELNDFEAKKMPSQWLEDSGEFNVVGRLDHFDLEVWDKTKNAYLVKLGESEAGKDADDLPVNIDVFIDKFILGTFEIDQLKVKGNRQTPFWVLNIESELMAGKVLVPEDDRPIGLDLEYLRFAAEDESENKKTSDAKESALADIDLSRAVDLDFSSQEFSLGDANYGAWQFKLRPIEGGVVVHDIHAESKGMFVGGPEGGAEFIWLKDGEGQSSQFTGQIRANNLADVFDAWGQEKLLESQSAIIEIDAQWMGAPDQVTLKSIEGLVNVDIRKGSFSRGAGSDENGLLRLLALFNFDTILRRLRLDFSDLASQGYSYDKIYGKLDFKNGKIFLTDPLIVEASSSYIQLVGTIDLVKEKINSEMVVTLPLASNAAFATALVVNLPAAVGVYLMSKIFKKQLDRASSISVGVKGSWEDPKVKVKKIFDNASAKKRGKEIKEERAQENQIELIENEQEATEN